MSELKKKPKKILVHIKWNIVKTMNVNVKNPTKPYSAPPYIQEKTDKRVSSFLLGVLQKPHTFLWSTENHGAFGVTEGEDVTLLHIGLRGQRLPQGQNGTFWGRGNTVEQYVLMLACTSQLLNVFGVLIFQRLCRACTGLRL